MVCSAKILKKRSQTNQVSSLASIFVLPLPPLAKQCTKVHNSCLQNKFKVKILKKISLKIYAVFSLDFIVVLPQVNAVLSGVEYHAARLRCMSHVYEEHSEAAPWERPFVANSEMSQRYSHGRIKPLGGIPIVNNLLGIDGFSMFTMCITACEVCVCVTMFLLKYECVCNTVSVDGFSVFITTCPIYRFIMPHYILEMCDHSSMLRFWHRHEFWLTFTLLCLKHEVAGQKHVLLFSLQKFMLCMHCTVCMQY